MWFFILALAFTFFSSVPLYFIAKTKHEYGFYSRDIVGLQRAINIIILLIFLFSWLLFYVDVPSFVWPLLGWFGCGICVLWIIESVVAMLVFESFHKFNWFAVAGLVILCGRSIVGWSAFRSQDYADMIGKVEEKKWTPDVQPLDAKHIRLVPMELAKWLANKQLGEASGAIGSQFHVSNEHMTLQMINGKLWYVAPLDFNGLGTWYSTGISPGYVKVDAENPLTKAVVVIDNRFQYMPGAYFSSNLKRHLWNNGYHASGLTDYTFEIDEEGSPWWVVTVFHPTIGWSGEKVDGVVIINPTTGVSTFSPIGAVPVWIDRVVPGEFVADYLAWNGKYHAGWLNSWFGTKDIVEPGHISIVYGTDNEPYWVTDVTSTNEKDQALVGVLYTCSRTGKSVLYKISGSTGEAILDAVKSKISFRHWHGADAVYYNIYGVMAAVVPLLGPNSIFQGVAIVRVDNSQVAIGDTAETALREFQNLLAGAGQQMTPDLSHENVSVNGKVDRFASEVKEKETIYYVHLVGAEYIFTGGSELSSKLPLTMLGDEVTVSYIKANEDVVPMLAFVNRSLILERTSTVTVQKKP